MQFRFTREQALELQEALIAEYGKPKFQSKLRVVLRDTCSVENKNKIDQELREVRQNIGARFGFEASPLGVAQSTKLFTPELLADPEIANNCNVVNILLFPQLQNDLDDKKNRSIPKKMKQFLKSRAEEAAKYEAEEAAKYEADKAAKKLKNSKVYIPEQVGRQWTVTCERGVLVRKGEELHSQELPTRLANDSVIKELELSGTRLHYQRLSGDGPDFGWVSVVVKGATLLCPLPDDQKMELPENI